MRAFGIARESFEMVSRLASLPGTVAHLENVIADTERKIATLTSRLEIGFYDRRTTVIVRCLLTSFTLELTVHRSSSYAPVEARRD